ncbi:MAG: tyrosine-type recombinase/integrase [Bacteroidia bacterium]
MKFYFLNCTFSEHSNQKVIMCHFEYNPLHLNAFKKEFPGAKWSQSKKCWYVADTSLYRKRLGLEKNEIGSQYETKIQGTNSHAFTLFRNTLHQRAYSPLTIKTYLGEFAQLLMELKGHDVNQLSTERLNAYFLYCIKKLKLSENQIHSRINAVKGYFKLVLNKPEIIDVVPRPRKGESLPKVLSKEEIKKIFDVTPNLKHKLMLKLAYGMGLRVSEVVNIKIADIDSNRMQVRIEQAKGKKDRAVNLPKSILPELRLYYTEYKPIKYLFEGQFEDKYSIRSVQAVFKRAMIRANINKVIGIHGLRHSYATHLLEIGTDMVFIQKLLGHKNIKTTEIYAKIGRQTLGKVQSPLDDL